MCAVRLPALLKVSCDGTEASLPTPDNAYSTVTSLSTAQRRPMQSVGLTLVFPCQSGFTGPVIYTCDAAGNFTTADSCVQVTCDGRANVVQTPANADTTVSAVRCLFLAGQKGMALMNLALQMEVGGTAQQAMSQPYGSTLIFQCGDGFSGSVTYICDSSGAPINCPPYNR